MSLEDEIRRIVREEIEREKYRMTQTVTHPPFDWPQVREKVVNDCPVCGFHSHVPCYHSHCPMRVPPAVKFETPPDMATIKATLYDNGVGPYDLGMFDIGPDGLVKAIRHPEKADLKRREQTIVENGVHYAGQPVDDAPIVPRRNGCTCPPGSQTSCPDVTCPWKPR